MSERIKPILSPELKAEEYCRKVQGIVEIALQEHFGKLDGRLRLEQFAGKLSTFPAKVQEGVNESSLLNQCVLFSEELQRCLTLIDFKTKQTVTPHHAYLTPENNPHDIIIDPTIGQAVLGHDHVFVGTRQQLGKLVLSQIGHKSSSYTLHGNSPKLLFETMWGPRSPLDNPIKRSFYLTKLKIAKFFLLK